LKFKTYNLEFPKVLLSSLILNLLIFTLAWAFCIKIKNYSPVDAFWSATIGLTALLYLIDSPSPPQLAAAILISAWSARLTYHLAKRIASHHPSEDPRYIKLRQHWQGRDKPMFLLFFLAQALSVFALAIPFYIISQDPNPNWHPLHTIATIVALTGLIGESIADRQMASFKKTNQDPSAVCQTGLWKYSRHPNYFFESVIWIGFFLFALPSPYGWTSLYAPAIITFLLLKVTGIPPTSTTKKQPHPSFPSLRKFKIQNSIPNEESFPFPHH
jgi:steroid 5-alpha reductase family enzyme